MAEKKKSAEFRLSPASGRNGLIVVKTGTALLASSSRGLNSSIINKIAGEISLLMKDGWKFAVVSSGAVGCGRLVTNSPRPSNIAEAQVLSSIGQPVLMNLWRRAFSRHGIITAQILTDAEDFSRRVRFLNLKRTILTLVEKNIIPVINENDAVAVSELKFGDNDFLASLLASHLGAEMLILLTNVDGVFYNGKLLKRIENAHSLASKMPGASEFGTGGVKSKLLASDITRVSDVALFIVNGRRKNIITGILNGNFVGTEIPPVKRISHRKRWICFASDPQGEIKVDSGASLAITKKNKSLLPAGVLSYRGDFKKGDVVSVKYGGKVFAKGIVNYSAEELGRICGKKLSDVSGILKIPSPREVINRDDLVILEN